MIEPEIAERIEILRRIAERGLKHAHSFEDPDSGFVDLFQHLLDELKRLEALCR